jgi:predicted transcriptional regulator
MVEVRTHRNGIRRAATVGELAAPVPVTIGAAASIARAARLMRAWDLPEVLVTDKGQLVGVLTERRVTVLAIAADDPPSDISAGDACDTGGPRLPADWPLDRALAFMRARRLQQAPVVARRDRLVGCVWATDIESAHHPTASIA